MDRFIFIFLFYAMGIISCSPVSPLEQALRLSGSNRPELEGVLHHFARLPEDSLKYRAACFLIENMPGHGWYEGEELEKYNKQVDSICAGEDFILKATLYDAFFRQEGAFEGLKKCEDIQLLDRHFLIRHIEYLFKAIENRPWLKELSFDQFCEYILPYRVGFEPPRLLHPLQDSMFRSLVSGWLEYDDARYNAALLFKLQHARNYSDKKNIKLWYKGQSFDYNTGECVNVATAYHWFARLLLFPCALDLNPAFPNKNARHCWAVMIDNTRSHSTNCFFDESEKLGKLYRSTFVRHRHPVSDGTEFIPPFFDQPFYKDVTSFYTLTEDVCVKPLVPSDTRNGYLCVFNDLKWVPVASAEKHDHCFNFKDVGRGVVYLPVVFPDQNAVCISYPFILSQTGTVHPLKPDTSDLKTIRLTRKYPQSQSLRLLNRMIIPAVVEASDDELFRWKDSVGRIDRVDSLQWVDLFLRGTKKYRYWRIRSSSFFTLAECFLYGEKGEAMKPLPGKGLFSLNFAAFDGDPLSYAYPYHAEQSYTLQWDMGGKVSFSRIEFLQHNDGNQIWPEHWYELYYHDGHGWNSLGVKEATERHIDFDHIPGNALLWLRDLTTGQEERIFTCTDGEIRFW